MRQDIEITVYFNIEAALQEGFPVHESGNGVILTGDVPLRYLTCVRLFDKDRDLSAGAAWPSPWALEAAAMELRAQREESRGPAPSRSRFTRESRCSAPTHKIEHGSARSAGKTLPELQVHSGTESILSATLWSLESHHSGEETMDSCEASSTTKRQPRLTCLPLAGLVTLLSFSGMLQVMDLASLAIGRSYQLFYCTHRIVPGVYRRKLCIAHHCPGPRHHGGRHTPDSASTANWIVERSSQDTDHAYQCPSWSPCRMQPLAHVTARVAPVASPSSHRAPAQGDRNTHHMICTRITRIDKVQQKAATRLINPKPPKRRAEFGPAKTIVRAGPVPSPGLTWQE